MKAGDAPPHFCKKPRAFLEALKTAAHFDDFAEPLQVNDGRVVFSNAREEYDERHDNPDCRFMQGKGCVRQLVVKKSYRHSPMVHSLLVERYPSKDTVGSG